MGKKQLCFLLLTVFLVVMILLALVIGSVSVPVKQIGQILANQWFGGEYSVPASRVNIIYNIRLPRVVLTVLVSMALSASGAVIQGIYQNPMADTGVLGISSGASFGAIVAVAAGFSGRFLFAMPLCAVAGALLTAFGIFSFSTRKGKVPILTLVLAGMAVSTLLRALVSLILSYMSEGEMKEYLYWSMGSLSAAGWQHVYLVVMPILAGLVYLLIHARELNILMLGEEEAQSVGLNPYRARKRFLFVTSLITAMAVCVSGGIQFVGLVIPHIMRLILGADNRYLLPASTLAGAAFLLLCDLLARTLISPAEIAVGILTSVIGAPYFLYLIYRNRKGMLS